MFTVNLGALMVQIRGENSQFIRSFNTAQRFFDNTSKRMLMLGTKMSLGITASVAMMSKKSIGAFASFDDAMTKSTAIMGGMTDDLRKEMESTARSMSRQTVTAADKLAESYFFLASAGLDAKNSIMALPVVNNMAIAGAFDMALATDMLTDAQSALGLSSKNATQNMMNMTRVSDVLVKANTLANASVGQFATSLTNKAAGALRLVNKDVEEGVAVLAAFADQGLKGEGAGEALNIVLRDLQNAAIKNSAVWQQMGLSVFDSSGKLMNMGEIVGGLERRFMSLSDEQKRLTAQQLGFQDRSFSYLATLLGTSSKIKEYERQLRMAGGTTKEVTDKQMKSFSSQMKILGNQIQSVSIDIGTLLAPSILRLNNYVKRLIDQWNGLSDATKKFIVQAVGIVAAIGPALIILSQVVKMGGTATMIFGKLASSFMLIARMAMYAGSIIAGVFAAMNFWVIGIVAGVAAAIGGITYALVGSDGMASAWNTVKTSMSDFFYSAVGFFVNFKENITLIGNWLRDKWKAVFIDMGEMVTVVLTNMIYNFKVAVQTMVALFILWRGWFSTMWKKLWEIDFLLYVSNAINWMQGAFFRLFDKIKGWFKRILSGEEIDKGKLVAQLSQAVVQGLTDGDVIAATGNVLKAGAGNMKSALEGFKSSAEAFPELSLKMMKQQEGSSKEDLQNAVENGIGTAMEAAPDNGPGPAMGETPETKQASNFQAINMRRFSLQGLTGFAPPKTQKVEAQGVESRLDTLIGVTKNKEGFALS